jgi:hypothetical protein
MCIDFNIPDPLRREWRCDDAVHPGPIVTDHMADMLLNYVCGQ